MLAALIPRLDLFISLIGALASSCLAIIFPAIIEICTFWVRDPSGDDDEREYSAEGLKGEPRVRPPLDWAHVWLITKNVLLLVFGFVGLATGSWQSLTQLFGSLDENKSK